jgi:hypothetical protein
MSLVKVAESPQEVLMTALEACALNPEMAKLNPAVLQI